MTKLKVFPLTKGAYIKLHLESSKLSPTVKYAQKEQSVWHMMPRIFLLLIMISIIFTLFQHILLDFESIETIFIPDSIFPIVFLTILRIQQQEKSTRYFLAKQNIRLYISQEFCLLLVFLCSHFRSCSCRILSPTTSRRSNWATITGWDYLKMDSTELGFGKMVLLFPLTCKTLKLQTKGVRILILFHTLDFLQRTYFQSSDIFSLLIGINVMMSQLHSFYIFILLIPDTRKFMPKFKCLNEQYSIIIEYASIVSLNI